MRRASMLVIVCVAMVAGWSGGPAAAASPVDEYVALGDSWAADATLSQVSGEYVPRGCVQSAHDYAKQVAAALRVATFRDATCGGAETRDMTGTQDAPLGGANPPQFDRLTPATDLVTLEIGGNDAGLAAAVQDCLTPNPAVSPCQAQWVPGGVDRMSARIAAAAPRVRATIAGIRARSPHARILLVDYLEGIDVTGGCFPIIPISPVDAAWLGRKLIELDAMLAGVAADTGVQFVNTYRDSVGHDACRLPGVRWVEGLIPFSVSPLGPAVPFHPNQLGADQQARSVLAALGR
ncbi:SGNH/GDSL hydrolase family protein [Nocardia sp. NEAU-G5]|uniref:SGNH/GDSL hydrolase family protein n=1 Tax=Nocardia albiluteola TaxID=2842303 RepID=A0ABS6B4R7_9NOCA|nr:SGNH/GDSL hydrolase family protein [Nocardia albiluteola]MBU3065307.1 SGNH/GDSL hydrolase family protein [Nocardia albiluteola]